MSTPEAPTNETVIGQIRLSGLFAGRYQIIKELAKGGMGVVYKAHDNVLDKTVALKFILYTDWTEDQLLRFQREAQASSRLLHPNIAVVYNFGLDENSTPYMVLEYVEGKTIKRIVNKRKFDILPTLHIGQQLCAALHHAHLNGLVHRDIKSSNVILDESQDPPIAKIIDFGIARIVDTNFRGTLSSDQVVPGSPPYMAPEQVKCKPMDHRCDIYSLGCVLFEMLTGEPPFRGDTAIKTMEMHVSKQPPLLHSVYREREFPDELEGLVARCLAKKPEDRFQSAAELKNELEKLQDAYQEFLAERARVAASDQNSDNKAAPKDKRTKKIGAALIAAALLITTAVAARLYYLDVFSTDMHIEETPIQQNPHDDEINKGSGKTVETAKDQFLTTFDIEEFRRNPRDIKLKYHYGDDALTEDNLKQLAALPVETLDIYYSDLPPNALDIISRMKTLRGLKLIKDANVNDKTLKNLSRLSNLTDLSISDHKDLTGSVLNDLRHMSIKRLNLRKCPSISAKSLEALSKWKELECLDLQNNVVSPQYMKALKRVANLKALILSESRFQAGTINVLKELPRLEALQIAYTKITDQDLNAIADVKGLKALDINGCPNLTSRGVLRLKQRLPNIIFLAPTTKPMNALESSL